MRRRKKKPVGSSEQERRSLSRQLFRPLATAGCCRPAYVSAFSGDGFSGLSAWGGAPWYPLSCICHSAVDRWVRLSDPQPPGARGYRGAPSGLQRSGAGSSGKAAATCLTSAV
jgi:hypothetical protein